MYLLTIRNRKSILEKTIRSQWGDNNTYLIFVTFLIAKHTTVSILNLLFILSSFCLLWYYHSNFIVYLKYYIFTQDTLLDHKKTQQEASTIFTFYIQVL